MILTGTDAQIVRPYKSLFVPASIPVKARRVATCRDARSVRPLCQSETYNNERRPLQQSPLLFYAQTSLLDILVLMEDVLQVSWENVVNYNDES